MQFSSWKYACIHRVRAALAATLTVLWVLAPSGVRSGGSAEYVPGSIVARVAAVDSSGGVAAEVATVAAEMAQIYTAISRCAPRMPEEERRIIASAIIGESSRHGYDPLFVQAIVEVESTCRPAVRSHAGAIGLIQIKPATARAVAERYGIRWRGPAGLLDPGTNVRLGLHYLAELEERFADPYLAVAAYNLGPTRVARMEPKRARATSYVRKVISRYEGLLIEYGAVAL